ncbi:MAG: vanillate O-demethylase oxidoreductase VanB [Gammaproteobacteria bacterium]|nr:vanillate O-demethylase oxidoreductase VanB [Gammaproteobacteria bacterium]MBJ54561.1 vanillate O-demethylase oxidoreductase VanB [Gammaproteobacteria bacterium]HBN15919.1 vanillate O-demethylase oxidoreductase VanB [Pseudohongiella sp.]|tara:strand:+ start:113 stop:562 length:450 start_codon:yes stop_codon:yes gene_type:complete
MSRQDTLIKVVELQAPQSRVWQALTDYRQFGEWFRVDLNEPFAPGSRSTGLTTYPGYEGYEWLATIETMEPESLFSFHWHHDNVDAHLPLAQRPTTRVEFRLEPIDGGTRLTITESGFAALPDDSRDSIIRNNTQGWDIQAEHIKAYVS